MGGRGRRAGGQEGGCKRRWERKEGMGRGRRMRVGGGGVEGK